MDGNTPTPQLLKELQKFEEKKKQYMRKKDLEQEIAEERRQPKNALYWFRHPNLRLIIAFTVVFLNFYIFAEDPVSHSVKDCHISIIGNIFSFLFANYPSNGYSALKILLWLFSITFGVVVGKMVIHHYLLCERFKLKIFSKDGQGSWMIIFLFTLLCLFYDSVIYNAFLTLGGRHLKDLHSGANMHIQYKTFNKAAAIAYNVHGPTSCRQNIELGVLGSSAIKPRYSVYLQACPEYVGRNYWGKYGPFVLYAIRIRTWFGDFITAWMVLDMMLQEDKYPDWMVTVRRWWNRGYNRVIAFWFVIICLTVLVVCFITTDIIDWDQINNGMVSTNELSRSFLAANILVFDLIIIMQDWDFPHFAGAQAIKLPGMHSGEIGFQLPNILTVYDKQINIEGKWFNYGILFIVMILDLNMWRSQLWYNPSAYGQYTDDRGRIYTVTDYNFLATANETTLSYTYRWEIYKNRSVGDPEPPGYYDHMTASTFQNFNVSFKGISFIPALTGFFLFAYFVYTLGQEKSEQELLVENWYNSKFIKKRRSRRVHPIIKVESDSDSDDDDETIIDITNTNKFNYYFQHPYLRLLILYTGVFLSWLLISEDPIGHSHAQGSADILGNAYNLVFGNYPRKAEYATLKIFMWLCAICSAIFFGKYIIHQFLLNGICRTKFFRKDQGSWIIMFIMFILSLYIWTLVFNEIVKEVPELKDFKITNEMQIKFQTFMKGVAISSFVTHFVMVLMITDVILQEKHYPKWAFILRRSWANNYIRIPIVWIIGIGMTLAAITAISIDLINWDGISSIFAASNELGRVTLAGFILFFDILIIIQDWEFPKFRLNENIKLPGLPVANFKFKLCCIEFELKGKWFTYGLLGLIIIIDTYNFKNQIMYEPMRYEQFVDVDHYIHSIVDEKYFLRGNTSSLNYKKLVGDRVKKVNAKYEKYNSDTKAGVASVPLLMAFFAFVVFATKRTLEERARKANN